MGSTTRGVHRVHSVVGFPGTFGRDRGISCMGISAVSLKRKDTGMVLGIGPSLFCGVLTRAAKLVVGSRRRLVSYLGRLSGTGGRCTHIGNTLRRYRTANCNVVVPSVDRLRLRRPRVIGRNKHCNIQLHTSTPSVRLVGTGVAARIDPVINDRGRSRSLMVCLLSNFRRSPIGV